MGLNHLRDGGEGALGKGWDVRVGKWEPTHSCLAFGTVSRSTYATEVAG